MLKWNVIYGALFLIMASVSLADDPGRRSHWLFGFMAPTEESTVRPPAVSGNIDFSVHDEAPVVRNKMGIAVRGDRESQGPVLHYFGFNEE